MRAYSLCYSATLLLCHSLPATSLEFSGSLGVETRTFWQDGQFADQLDSVQASVFVEPELTWYSEDSAHQLALTLFARGDGQDDERSHFDVREAYWLWIGEDWELTTGVNRVFWGVTESRHLVNVINQIDSVEDIDEEDFLGQPMVQLTLQRDYGAFSFFVLPGFRERTFAGEAGRLRAPLPVDEDGAVYESGAEEWHVDFAARYSHYFGDWDVGAYYFYGTGREPSLIPNARGNALIPFYELIHQGGLDLQYTTDAWLWKLEGIVREGQGDTFGAAVAGFEYTSYQVGGSAADIGWIAEYLYDGRDAEAPATLFQDDVFLGSRLAMNDAQDSSVLLGTVMDLEESTMALRMEAERRIGDSFKVELELQWFAKSDAQSVAQSFADDSFVTLRVTRFF